jgi:hypothetical protein
MAQPSSFTARNRKLAFRFTADRFGFRTEAHGLSIEYARDATVALGHWRKTIETLFGDPQSALALAADAGIFPRNSDWRSIDECLRLVSSRVQQNPGQQPVDELGDPSERNALREIRDYLEMLEQWALTLQAGIWASLIASVGSTADDPTLRRRQGLKALGAVHEFDLGEPLRVLDRLRHLVRPNERLRQLLDQHAEHWHWLPLYALGNKLVLDPSPPGAFPDQPSALDQWLQRVDEDLAPYLGLPSASAIGPDWIDLELVYWFQWSWSGSGPVRRNPDSQDASVVDLIYTTRHGGTPVVPVRGGNLTILQWSRIISLALRRSSAIPPDPVYTAANNLSLPELGVLANRERRDIKLEQDIIVICPRSAQSRASTWQPDPEFPALAAIPRDLAVGDLGAELSTMMPKVDAGAELGGLDPLGKALEKASAQAVVQFVEVDATDLGEAERAPAPYNVARPSLSYFTFGFGVGARAPGPYLDRPRDVRHLMQLTRDQYGYLLPSSLAEERSMWGTLKFVSRVIAYPILQVFGLRSNQARQRIAIPDRRNAGDNG